MYIFEFTKQTFDSPRRSHSWERELADGTTIDSVAAFCTQLDTDTDESDDMIDGVDKSGAVQVYTVQAGLSGKDYKITLQMERSDGQTSEVDILMHVRDT